MTSRSTIDPAVIDDLVDANHILYQQGIVDAFGHVSARHPENPAHFLIARSMAPALVTAGDIVELDRDANPIHSDTPGSYLERFIHSEIYRARPDVVAVVHSHSGALIPFGLVPGVSLKAVWHMGGYVGEGAGVYEIRDAGGPATDMLVKTPELGRALATSLGTYSIVLMRGHGATIVATASIRQAVYRAVYAERSARVQLEALRLGEPVYFTPEEAKAAALTMDANVPRAWELWKREVRKE